MDDWVLFLGAGASVAEPTRLPMFKALSDGVLDALGWSKAVGDDTAEWTHPAYPSFQDPDVSAEVLFGALHRFEFDFVEQLAELFAQPDPNAVHAVAAQVLRAGGCVWTTNVDMGVEHACATIKHPISVAAGGAERASQSVASLRSAAPGDLVKLHGTAAAPATMAFTDLELMAPLDEGTLNHLRGHAAGRTVVLYGYAGADADLADLLDECFSCAAQVIWLEPVRAVRQTIRLAFRSADRIDFRPEMSDGVETDFVGIAQTLLHLAGDAGADVEPDQAVALLESRGLPPMPLLQLPTPPGIAQARLVERFGSTANHNQALWAARLDDARHHRAGTLNGHMRWTLARSLYDGGMVARAIGWGTGHRRLLAGLKPTALRDYAITRACGLLLLQGDWHKLGSFAEWAVGLGRGPEGDAHPSDLYYRAQARRYDLRPRQAREDADQAIAGLSTTEDPERLAGALFESGCAAVYEGRFEEAERRAFDLQHRRGRYAIARWRGWGAWLEAVALCHLNRPAEAASAAAAARKRFEADGRETLLADAETVELLVARVHLAHGGHVDQARLDRADSADVHGRYRDDLDLALADIEIATGQLASAQRRLRCVLLSPSSPTAEANARIGQAELQRLNGEQEAAAAFAAILDLAQARQAVWLSARAVIGLRLCEDPKAEEAWDRVRCELPEDRRPADPIELSLGEPRVLWLLSV